MGSAITSPSYKRFCRPTYRRRQAQKTRATGSHPQRNEQFENIQRWRQQYQAVGNPVLSMDTPKKN